jgi:hypothetical protein
MARFVDRHSYISAKWGSHKEFNAPKISFDMIPTLFARAVASSMESENLALDVMRKTALRFTTYEL